ncbi:MAG: sulfite exporter TauE/SafE family protein [Clostridia bacterium]|nr:sulfite exporter TauE/SafE family protein [Clostridia bacterium]
MQKKHKMLSAAGGFCVGLLNGFFGAGGGVLAVPLLRRCGLSSKESHAGAIGIILPITLLSAGLYIHKGYVGLPDVYPFVPGGLIGSVAGALFLKKITSRLLCALFGAMMIFAGLRMAAV